MRIRNGATVFALGSLLIGCDRDPTAPAGASADNLPPQLAAIAASWSLKAPLHKPRSNAKAATVNGVVYAIGGYVFESTTGLQVRARKADMPFTVETYAGHQGMIDARLYVYAA